MRRWWFNGEEGGGWSLPRPTPSLSGGSPPPPESPDGRSLQLVCWVPVRSSSSEPPAAAAASRSVHPLPPPARSAPRRARLAAMSHYECPPPPKDEDASVSVPAVSADGWTEHVPLRCCLRAHLSLPPPQPAEAVLITLHACDGVGGIQVEQGGRWLLVNLD